MKKVFILMLVVVLVAQFTGCTTKIITVATAENPEPERGFNWGWLILLIYPFVLIAEAFEAIGEFFTNLFQGLF